MATIFLAVYGKEGIRELAEHNLAKADYAAKTLSRAAGRKAAFHRRAALPRICFANRRIAGALGPAAPG